MPAYIKHVFFSVLFVIAAVNFTRTTLDIIESSKRLDDLKTTVSTLEDKKEALKADLEYKKSDTFVEQEARNQLGMAKLGEELFVAGDILGVKATSNSKPSETSPIRLWVKVFAIGFDNIDAL